MNMIFSRRHLLVSGTASVCFLSGAKAQSSFPAPALIAADLTLGRGRYVSPCDGSNSDSDALDLMIQDITNGGTNPGQSVIHLPSRLALTRKPLPLGGIRLMGQGAVSTHLYVRGYIAGTLGGRYLLDFTASPGGRYGGGVEGLSIETTEHTGGVTLIALNVPQGGTPPARTRFADLRLGAGSAGPKNSWLAYRCLQFLGRGDTSPIGLRNLTFSRIEAFGVSQTDTIWIDQAHASTFEDIAAFPTNGGGRVTIINSIGASGRGLNWQGGYQLSGNTGSSFVGVAGGLL